MQPLAGAGQRTGKQESWRIHPLSQGWEVGDAPVVAPRPLRRGRGGQSGIWAWRVAGLGLLVIALLAGAVHMHRLAEGAPGLGDRLNGLLVRAGLGVNQVWLMGHGATPADDIFAALALDEAGALPTYDVAAARRRIEALPWVARASLTRLLPDTLDVRIVERTPYAVWRRGDRFDLIDAEGRVLGPVPAGARTDLPLVVGAGAAREARALLAMLADHPALRDNLSAAIRVGGRRWTLRLVTGPDILLPADKPRRALRLLASLEARHRLLDRAIVAVDLRIPGKIALRLPKGLADRIRPAPRIGAGTGSLAPAGRSKGQG